MATYVCVIEISLDLRHCQSLKEKRKVVSSLKAQLRQRFVAAVAETAHHDDRRRFAQEGEIDRQQRGHRAGRRGHAGEIIRRVRRLVRDKIG